jgi:tRNA threonylcarbamoyl adenosine modification protein YeaZ
VRIFARGADPFETLPELRHTGAMIILAIDTALAATSACVLQQGKRDPIAGETLRMERGHAEALLPLVDRVMARVDGGFESLSRVAVTTGPGSFTGIRIGIAAARAIGLACGVPVVGISALAAFAAPLINDSEPSTAVASIDARHGMVFFQAFGHGGRALAPPALAPIREAARSLGEGPFRLTGPGAKLMAEEARKIGTAVDVVGALVSPEIVFVAGLGIAADPATALPRPLYLKAPDARPQEAAIIPRA